MAILYFSWLLIDSWYVLFKRSYLTDGFQIGAFEFVKDVLLGTTFPGSWFISALLISVLLVHIGVKYLGKYITVGICLFLSLYVWYAETLPDAYRVAYDWYAAHINRVILSFPSQMIWVAIGMLIGCNLSSVMNHKKKLLSAMIVLPIICYFTTIFHNNPFVRYVLVSNLCILSLYVDLPYSLVYNRIRNYSILIYLFHFSIAGKMSLFCSMVGDGLLTNWIFYFLVVIVSIIFAEIVLRLEKVHQLSFLKYLH